MLFTTVSALLFALPALGGVLPSENKEVRSESIPVGVSVVLGKPDVVFARACTPIVEIPGRRDLQLFSRAISADQKEALRLHNVARAKKKVRSMVWSPTLAGYALTYAKKLAKAGTLKHSAYEDRINQGENLAYAKSSQPITQPSVLGTKGWLAEKDNYNGEKIPKGDFAAYGHYTQIMWNTSTRFGIASVSDGKGAWYTVARYSKPGNINGLRPY
ncbi:CAP domain-containing protein [Dactylonectria macrodidyma]|uniref:CAP domain-containing protein n=1 Tax=Dactylonectria macrodidyma TaxID=307937 RepID=A0A9P9J6R2_9HYPO|nr:CAP domain-containing protein [Dactylonectria macrodidyma]